MVPDLLLYRSTAFLIQVFCDRHMIGSTQVSSIGYKMLNVLFSTSLAEHNKQMLKFSIYLTSFANSSLEDCSLFYWKRFPSGQGVV